MKNQLELHIKTIIDKVNHDGCIETADRPYYIEKRINLFLSKQTDYTPRQLKNYIKAVASSWRNEFKDYRLAARVIQDYLNQTK